MKQETKNFLFNVAHSIIIIIIAIDTCTLIGNNFPQYELPFLFGFIGLIDGLGFGGIWEYGIEENFLRMPSSKGDLINMSICGAIAGVLCAYFQFNHNLLWVSSIVSAIFVVWYIAKMYKTKHLRPKINF